MPLRQLCEGRALAALNGASQVSLESGQQTLNRDSEDDERKTGDQYFTPVRWKIVFALRERKLPMRRPRLYSSVQSSQKLNGSQLFERGGQPLKSSSRLEFKIWSPEASIVLAQIFRATCCCAACWHVRFRGEISAQWLQLAASRQGGFCCDKRRFNQLKSWQRPTATPAIQCGKAVNGQQVRCWRQAAKCFI